MKKIVGVIDKRIVDLLNLDIEPGTKIYIGDSNIEHMKNRHPNDYAKYGNDIEHILSNPDYVGIHKKGSLEYVKEYKTDDEYVKVAVRISGHGNHYARSMYILNNERVLSFIERGTLKKY